MKKTILLGFVLLAAFCSAQTKESDVSPATRRYHEFRQQATEPSFGLAKVKAVIAKIKPQKGADEDYGILATSAWARLSPAEKFTYCMLHGEVSSQNCDMMPWMVDEEHKVFAYPPSFKGGEENWSDRQRAFLKSNRGKVIRLLRSTIREKNRVGTNLKYTITELGTFELIPDLVKAYNRDHRDQDILSVLLILMKDGKFKPFLASATYRKLYGESANYQSFVVANAANQKLTIDRAMAYYRSRVG